MNLSYHLLDVFTTQLFGGNQLAVFPDAKEIPADLMQQIAKELNLSETVFVFLPQNPQYDFRLRIFTPDIELPMAGHPTVGTAYLLARLGLIPSGQSQVIFEEGVGPITTHIERDHSQQPIRCIMQQPLPEFGQVFENRSDFAQLLSLDENSLHSDLPIQVVSTGVPFVFIPIRNLDAIREVKVDLQLWERLLKDTESPHVFTFTLESESLEATVHSRMFAPAMGIPEDPATGAASGPLGAYLVQNDLVSDPKYIISEQGIELGRPSMISIHIGYEDGVFTSVAIGGQCVLVGEGVFRLP